MQATMSELCLSNFRQALEGLNRAQVPYAIGGAFAVFHYSGAWRNTNDLDLYLERKYIPAATRALEDLGFHDSGEQAAGDREWIYHALKGDVLIDLIWQPPTFLSTVDERFIMDGPEGVFLDVPVRFLPADRLILTKLFTLNRHRCDWPDIFNIVRARPEHLNWEFLLRKVGDNWPVLLSFVLLFEWVYPNEATSIPLNVRHELCTKLQQVNPGTIQPIREALLDPWIYSRPISP